MSAKLWENQAEKIGRKILAKNFCAGTAIPYTTNEPSMYKVKSETCEDPSRLRVKGHNCNKGIKPGEDSLDQEEHDQPALRDTKAESEEPFKHCSVSSSENRPEPCSEATQAWAIIEEQAKLFTDVLNSTSHDQLNNSRTSSS